MGAFFVDMVSVRPVIPSQCRNTGAGIRTLSLLDMKNPPSDALAGKADDAL